MIATVESVGSLASLAFTFIFPKLINHGLEPGTIYFAIAAFGLLPLPFVRYVIYDLLLYIYSWLFSRDLL